MVVITLHYRLPDSGPSESLKPLLSTRRLSKVFHLGSAVYALTGVDLDIFPGEFIIIRGPSGSGKSTLLSLLAGLDRPTSGSIILDGMHLERLSETALADLRRRRMGYVFQLFNLVEQLSALHNVALPLTFSRTPAWYIEERCQRLLERVGLAHRSHHLPRQLSGGEQQRVAIARALVNEPAVLLADEPTGNLDTNTTNEIMDLMAGINSELQQTSVIVTHDPRLDRYADRIFHMADGQVVSVRKGGRVG